MRNVEEMWLSPQLVSYTHTLVDYLTFVGFGRTRTGMQELAK